MKILLDACVWGGAKKEISASGNDAEWVGDWQKDPGDDEILAHAYQEGRVLVTLDKDFGTLAVLHGKPHVGIIRLVNIAARQQGIVCLRVAESHQEELQQGALITVEGDKIRVRMSGGG